ncbi:MAG: hypothetical protein QMD96_03300 [Anaerosomatales bacterium]|jgi:hypothetical protein|nr:hypothetical protein [Anaerosomatales bacterium]
MQIVWLIAILAFLVAMTAAVISAVRQMGLSDPCLNSETWKSKRSSIVRVTRSDVLWVGIGALGLAVAAILDGEFVFALAAVLVIGPGCVALMLWYRRSTWELVARRLRQLG